ncbi:hypothetical protein LO762_02125 [Actinocorallia sp. API 0066]|uniref:hypothetical protein n=1 Tax=Actinocorallia sp. API 0066 TaxID=2896846 RepID=UPI001E5D09E6|nr:hypothetical protein [Actinocorallia sp. API 0066]MCD0447998.1 hypothetical protein [Actinocorallia sp. API 0066]
MSAVGRRALCLLVAALTVLGAAPASAEVPPGATARWDRIAAALREDPLFVDTDLTDAFDPVTRRELRVEMDELGTRLGARVFVFAVPNTGDSEANGREELLVDGVRERLGEDGVYLLIDHDGRLAGDAYGVPRYFGYDFVDWEIRRPADWARPFADLLIRVSRTFDEVAAAPSAEAKAPSGPVELPSFTKEKSPPREPAFWGPFSAGVLLLGPALALAVAALWTVGRFYALRRREQPAPARPSRRYLRAASRRALRDLAAALAKADDGPGAGAALRAYDAAVLLADEALRETEENAALDYVGVVVLGRQGLLALAEDLPEAPAFCQANPLHGRAVAARTLRGDAYPAGRVCASCADLPARKLKRSVLRVPDGRRYPLVPGRWQRGFGGRPDLAARVLESLGV